MISNRSKGIRHLVVICQCILVTIGFWVWLLLCHSLPIDLGFIYRYLIYNECVLLGLLVGSLGFTSDVGLYTPDVVETGRRACRQLSGALFSLLLYLVATHDNYISRLFFFSFLPFLFLILFTSNRLLPSLLGRSTLRRGLEQKVQIG